MRRWLARLLVASFVQPRQAVREVLQLNLSNRDVVALAALVAILLTITIWFLGFVTQATDDPFQEFIKGQPLLIAIIQLLSIPLGASISMGIARLFGGKGLFRDSVLVILWLNGAMAVMQLFLVLVLPVLAPIAGILFFAALVWFIVAYAAGITEVHGFKNIYLVMAAMIGIFFLFVVLLNYLAITAGFVPPGMA